MRRRSGTKKPSSLPATPRSKSTCGDAWQRSGLSRAPGPKSPFWDQCTSNLAPLYRDIFDPTGYYLNIRMKPCRNGIVLRPRHGCTFVACTKCCNRTMGSTMNADVLSHGTDHNEVDIPRCFRP